MSLDDAIAECEAIHRLCLQQGKQPLESFRRALETLYSCRDAERPFPFSPEVYLLVVAYQLEVLTNTVLDA